MQPLRTIDDKTVSTYLRDISKSASNDLAPEQERKLARQARKGNETARQQLIVANLRLVISIVKRYIGKGLSFADLINEGNLGLIDAVHHFDERKGVRLSTYATWAIRHRIVNALANKKLVKFPLSARLLTKRIKDSYIKISNKFGREPTINELAQELNVTQDDIAQAFLCEPKEFSLNDTLDGDQGIAWSELIEKSSVPSPEEIFRKTEIKEEINKVLNTLTDREREVIEGYFGMSDGPPKTLSEIGKKWGVSRERVRQIKKQALKKLKGRIQNRELREFLKIS